MGLLRPSAVAQLLEEHSEPRHFVASGSPDHVLVDSVCSAYPPEFYVVPAAPDAGFANGGLALLSGTHAARDVYTSTVFKESLKQPVHDRLDDLEHREHGDALADKRGRRADAVALRTGSAAQRAATLTASYRAKTSNADRGAAAPEGEPGWPLHKLRNLRDEPGGLRVVADLADLRAALLRTSRAEGR